MKEKNDLNINEARDLFGEEFLHEFVEQDHRRDGNMYSYILYNDKHDCYVREIHDTSKRKDGQSIEDFESTVDWSNPRYQIVTKKG